VVGLAGLFGGYRRLWPFGTGSCQNACACIRGVVDQDASDRSSCNASPLSFEYACVVAVETDDRALRLFLYLAPLFNLPFAASAVELGGLGRGDR